MSDEVASLCGQCGASVYRQHIDSGIARFVSGKLLCAHCAADAAQEQVASLSSSGGHDYQPIAIHDDDDDEPAAERLSKSRISIAHKPALGGTHKDHHYARALDVKAPVATRCRSFHAKLSEGALDFMNNQVNSWVDSDPNVVIKFATSTIGVFEGKHAEPHLILTVFY